ncbi:MAG: restriction endonuclease subunit S [Subdoligranulum sp.]|nr:restriction endonuclease subunit S [Subdoligranulum sp.]
MAKKKEILSPKERLQAALVPEGEQPYPVPGNWCWTRMENIAQWGSGGTPSRKIPEYYNGDIPWIKTGELNDDYIFETEEHITEEAISHSSAKLFPVNTVAIAMYGATIGKVGILGIAATTNQACACGISNPSTNYKYLFYYARSQKDNFIKKGKGGAQPNISQEIIKSHEFPLPPLSEQQRIVDRIESLFAKLDEAKQKAQDALYSFETRKAAILHKAFTGELTAQWRKEYGMGMESWRRIPLKKCGSWYGGGTPSMGHSEYWENGTLLWVTSKDMKSDLIEDTLMHTNMLGVENSSANYIEEPAVLFVMRSGILRRTFPVCMVKKPFTVNQDLKALVPTDDINLEYLFWVCKANEKQILEKCMKSGTTVESINTTALRDFEIPIAGKNEQGEIIRILDDLLAKEQQAKEAAEGVMEQIDLIKKAILARAFRGELGTNDPSEESAQELMKKFCFKNAAERES